LKLFPNGTVSPSDTHRFVTMYARNDDLLVFLQAGAQTGCAARWIRWLRRTCVRLRLSKLPDLRPRRFAPQWGTLFVGRPPRRYARPGPFARRSTRTGTVCSDSTRTIHVLACGAAATGETTPAMASRPSHFRTLHSRRPLCVLGCSHLGVA